MKLSYPKIKKFLIFLEIKLFSFIFFPISGGNFLTSNKKRRNICSEKKKKKNLLPQA